MGFEITNCSRVLEHPTDIVMSNVALKISTVTLLSMIFGCVSGDSRLIRELREKKTPLHLGTPNKCSLCELPIQDANAQGWVSVPANYWQYLLEVEDKSDPQKRKYKYCISHGLEALGKTGYTCVYQEIEGTTYIRPSKEGRVMELHRLTRI